MGIDIPLKGTSFPIRIFYFSADEDEQLRQQLEDHLSALRHQGIIIEWHYRQIMPGANRKHAIDEHIETAHLILLLVSSDFLASEGCYGVEMQRALTRHRNGEVYVIPVLLRPVDRSSTPFRSLQCLPRNGKAVTEWENRDDALREVAIGVREVVEHLCFAAHMECPLPPLPRWFSASSTAHMRSSSPHNAQYRQRLLKQVHRIWIGGVLNEAREGLITVDLHEYPDAVENPWLSLVQESTRREHPLPAGTSITQVYDEADGELLILGEPGAGKTTLLLELARDLLARAERDASSPLPVIFHLSSWAEKRCSLTDWIVEELFSRYYVPRSLGREWVDAKQVLLLLDGLDEVTEIHRSACLKEINAYRREHNLISLVVCSRTTEYRGQVTHVALNKAVVIQPLAPKQIDQHLANGGKGQDALRRAIYGDPDLQEIARKPLMLNILTHTYQEMASDEVTPSGSLETKQRQIWTAYLQRMLARRSPTSRYTPAQTIGWLAYLSWQMRLHSQTVFYIEHMQRDWSVNQRVRLIGTILECLIVIVPSGWLFGISAGSFYEMASILKNGLIVWLLIGAGGMLCYSLIASFLSGLAMRKKKIPRLMRGLTWSWAGASLNWPLGLAFGGLLGLLSGISSELAYGVISRPTFGLVGGLISGVAGAMVGTVGSAVVGALVSENKAMRTVKVSRLLWVSGRQRLVDLLLYGVIGGLLFGLTARFVYRQAGEPIFSIFGGLFFGVLGGLLFGTLTRDIGESQPAGVIIWSWRRFQQNVSFISSGVLIGGLCYGLCFGLIFGWKDGLLYGLFSGLCIGPFLGFTYGLAEDVFREQEYTRPNEGIRRSARKGIFGGLAVMFLAGLSYLLEGLLFGRVEDRLLPLGQQGWSILTLFLILTGGFLYGWIISGGIVCMQHFIQRLLLWLSRALPWNLSAFLDYATERILLRKVGGGYIFIHRLLLDYFADLTVATLPVCCLCGHSDDRPAVFCPQCGQRMDKSNQEQIDKPTEVGVSQEQVIEPTQ